MPDECFCVNVCMNMPFQNPTNRRGDGLYIRTISLGDYIDRGNQSASWSWSYSRVLVREGSMIVGIIMRPWCWTRTPLPPGNNHSTPQGRKYALQKEAKTTNLCALSANVDCFSYEGGCGCWMCSEGASFLSFFSSFSLLLHIFFQSLSPSLSQTSLLRSQSQAPSNFQTGWRRLWLGTLAEASQKYTARAKHFFLNYVCMVVHVLASVYVCLNAWCAYLSTCLYVHAFSELDKPKKRWTQHQSGQCGKLHWSLGLEADLTREYQ